MVPQALLQICQNILRAIQPKGHESHCSFTATVSIMYCKYIQWYVIECISLNRHMLKAKMF